MSEAKFVVMLTGVAAGLIITRMLYVRGNKNLAAIVGIGSLAKLYIDVSEYRASQNTNVSAVRTRDETQLPDSDTNAPFVAPPPAVRPTMALLPGTRANVRFVS